MGANKLRAKLSHILWIGGGTDAGKTTVAEALAERHNLTYYNFDRNERSHIDRMAAAGYYTTRKNPYDMTPDEMWVDPDPVDMAAGVIQSWSRRAEFAIDDLRALTYERFIIAEGPGFFPEMIGPLLSSPHQAIWLVPESRFKRRIAIQRGKPGVRLQTRDPARATENIIRRDLLVSRHVRQEAIAHGLKWLEIDGTQSIETVTAIVEQHFAPYLDRNRPQNA